MRAVWLVALCISTGAGAGEDALAQVTRLPVSYSPNAVAGIKVYVDWIVGPTPVSADARVLATLSYATIGLGHGVGADTKPVWHTSLALNLLRGPRVPVALSIDGHYWVETVRSGGLEYRVREIPVGIGISPRLRRTGWAWEPWIGVRVQIRRSELGDASENEVGYGMSAGTNLDLNFLLAVWKPLGDLGVHVAGDYLAMPRAFRSGVLRTLTGTVGLNYTFRLSGLPERGIIDRCDGSDPACVLGPE